MDQPRIADVGESAERATRAAGTVLLTLASAQFLMTLDSSVMNVSIATVADVELDGGIPFVSDDDLETELDKAGVPPNTADAIVDENADARVDGLRTRCRCSRSSH